MASITQDTETWHSIDTQVELNDLADRVNWSDAEVVAFVGGTDQHQSYFPSDVSRSGHVNWNARILLLVFNERGSHLELTLIDSDEFSPRAVKSFTLRGHVDSLRRVDVHDFSGSRVFRCSRLLYRFLTIDQMLGREYYGFGPR